jgi:hypothetical protein
VGSCEPTVLADATDEADERTASDLDPAIGFYDNKELDSYNPNIKSVLLPETRQLSRDSRGH